MTDPEPLTDEELAGALFTSDMERIRATIAADRAKYRGALRTFRALAEGDRALLSEVNEDYQADVDTVVVRIAELEAENARLREDHAGACETVAKMHEAAVGKVTGPRRGVIEDVADVRAALRQCGKALERMMGELQSYVTEDSASPIGAIEIAKAARALPAVRDAMK